jgi:Na+-driven multidrug efflux pump
MGLRLDYLLIPLLFARGTATLTMVGTNVGGGQLARARRVAWIAALISAGATGLIGSALLPAGWIGLFSREPEGIRVGVDYLHRAAPFYAFYGLGMALYFASQGAGKVAWPLLAGCMRLAVVAIGGWYWPAVLGGSLQGFFWIIAARTALFGLVIASTFASGLSWGGRKPAASR